MRDYAKIAPQFWIGETGKKLRGNRDAQIVAFYLISNPHANMIGMYYLPKMFIAHETGITFEGASKGLARCIEAGFCGYDESAEVVWVYEMARFQIADSLKAEDKRCAGIQKDYNDIPQNRFLAVFYDKYAGSFNLTSKRVSASSIDAPSMPLRSQEQEQEQKQEQKQEGGAQKKRAPSSPAIACPDGVDPQVWSDWLSLRKAKRAPVTQTVLNGAISEAAKAGMSLEAFLQIWCRRGSQGLEAAWLKPEERAQGGAGRQIVKFDPTRYVNDKQYAADWDAQKGGGHGRIIDIN